MMRTIRLLLPAVLLPLASCSSYYLVRDPASGSTYYTKDVERTGSAGSVKFKDAATGAEVIIQQSEVLKISEDEYEAAAGRKR